MSRGERGPAPGPRRWLFRLAQVAIVLTTGGFVVSTLARHWAGVEQLHFQPQWASLGFALLLAIGYLVLRGLLWHRIVRRAVGEFTWGLDTACWLASTLGKYVPGKVLLVLGRVFVYRRLGARASAVGLAFLLEMAALFVTAPLLFAWAALTTDLPAPVGLRVAAGAMAAGSLAAIHPRVLGALVALYRRFSAEQNLELPVLRLRDTLGDVAQMVGNWLVLGCGFWLLSQSLTPLPFGSVAELTGAFALAGVAGIAVLVAPSGVGVREGVLTVLLAPLLGPGVAAALAVLARLWMTLAELVTAAIALWWLKRHGPQVPAVGRSAG